MEQTAEVTDGYHTMAELYEHRHALFALLMREYHFFAWKTRKDKDGKGDDGWFIAGITTGLGQVTYHMPDEWWDRLPFAKEIERNADYDGHTSADVLDRLIRLLKED